MTDDYPTCAETFVTLRVYHDSASPSVVTKALGLKPTMSQCVGESYEKRGSTRNYALSGWFFRSKGKVKSYNTAKHLDWLLLRLQPLHKPLKILCSQGWRMDIACYWDSQVGHGGPTLSPELLRRLSALGIEIWFDVYFLGEYQRIRGHKEARATPPAE